MKHEYTFEELAELKRIYDESGEAGLELDEMRALRKAGLVTQDLPPKPHEDTLADYAISVPKPKPEPVKLESANTNRNPEMRQAEAVFPWSLGKTEHCRSQDRPGK